jgi:ectoine hydroxylase-related dioxygenase (phytanoyl-CoA dioxygenase family)
MTVQNIDFFNKNQFIILSRIFKEEEIPIVKNDKTEKENFGEKTDLYILDWCKNEFQNIFLEKIINIIHDNTGLKKDYLRENFTKKVYYTEDSMESLHRNQIYHYDSYPSIKCMIYLSDNSKPASGCITFLKNSHRSFYMMIINFLRFFYVPAKHGVKQNLFYNNVINKCSSTEAFGEVGSVCIFNTDVFHKAGIVGRSHFRRKVLRFDFKKDRKSGIYIDGVISKFLK